MIRVLHSVSNMDRAGVETMLMNYYRHIDKNKVQFDFLCNKKKPGAYDDEIRALGGKIYHTPGLNPFKYGQYVKFMRSFAKKHPEYKIIHCHNAALAAYPLFAAKVAGIPERICHVHSASITFDYKWPIKIVCKRFLKPNLTKMWACGKAAGAFYYGKAAVDSGKVRVINNAIEIDRFVFNENVRNEMRQKHGLENSFVIGHAGRFMTQKNHAFLIKVFAELCKKESTAKLVLLGDGELQEDIKKQVVELQIEDRVLFMGNVSNVNEWYQAFDVFVLPSIWEGLPVVGIEAQAADLPCVFSADVTNEVGILKTTVFLSRKLPLEKWVKCILSYKGKYERVNRAKEIAAAGYDIKCEAQKLQQKYLELYDALTK